LFLPFPLDFGDVFFCCGRQFMPNPQRDSSPSPQKQSRAPRSKGLVKQKSPGKFSGAF